MRGGWCLGITNPLRLFRLAQKLLPFWPRPIFLGQARRVMAAQKEIREKEGWETHGMDLRIKRFYIATQLLFTSPLAFCQIAALAIPNLQRKFLRNLLGTCHNLTFYTSRPTRFSGGKRKGRNTPLSFLISPLFTFAMLKTIPLMTPSGGGYVPGGDAECGTGNGIQRISDIVTTSGQFTRCKQS